MTEPNLKGALCLVTGGAGFIGSHLVRRLLDEGSRVRVLDDFSTGRRERLEDVESDIELLEDSVTDREACERVVAGVDSVFHQAALPSVERSIENPQLTHDTDATGTLNLLVAAKDAGVRRFIYAASSSAYGDTQVLPKSENLASVPRSPYAAAKLVGEHYTRIFSWVYGLETVALRYFNVFGPGQDPASHYAAVVPVFITSALRGESPTIQGDGEQTRDFTYIANVLEANLLAQRAPARKVSGHVFNVACGSSVSVNQLWQLIKDLTGTDAEAVYEPPRPGDVRDSVADLESAATRLGYSPSVGLKEGLEATVGWFRERNVQLQLPG